MSYRKYYDKNGTLVEPMSYIWLDGQLEQVLPCGDDELGISADNKDFFRLHPESNMAHSCYPLWQFDHNDYEVVRLFYIPTIEQVQNDSCCVDTYEDGGVYYNREQALAQRQFIMKASQNWRIETQNRYDFCIRVYAQQKLSNNDILNGIEADYWIVNVQVIEEGV